jgi:hypothetical protein
LSRRTNACLICGARGDVKVRLCLDDLAILQGRTPIEQHHPVGRANGSETVGIPVGVHAALSTRQAKWPAAMKSPSPDPIITIARRMRALRDTLDWFLSASARDADWLLAMALTQQEAQGPEWWTANPIAPLYPAGEEG